MNAIERIRRHPAGNIAVVFTVVLAGCIIAGLAIPDDFRFLHSANVAILLRTIPLLGILAIGVGLLMITGEFDLSVGSVFGFSALVAAMLFREEWPLWLAIIIGLCRRWDHWLCQRPHRHANSNSIVHRDSRLDAGRARANSGA